MSKKYTLYVLTRNEIITSDMVSLQYILSFQLYNDIMKKILHTILLNQYSQYFLRNLYL